MSLIGKPLPRPDGRIKVTGGASYAADHRADRMLHAAYVTAPVPTGRVLAVNAARALTQPGIVRVLTAADMPRLGDAPSPPRASRFWPMQGDEVRHEGQPVAIVLAETLEAAEGAARLVDVRYERLPFSMPGEVLPSGPDDNAQHAHAPAKDSRYLLDEAEFRKGDAEAGLAMAAHRVEQTYVQPSRHNNPMEPSGTLAEWTRDADGDRLTVHDAVQHGYSAQAVLAAALGLKPEQVRVVCPHTGGGFGAKGYVWPHQVLAAASARVVGRPVKLVLTRAQMYSNVGYQPRMVQTVALGADAGGRLTAIRHDVVNVTGVSDDFVEFATAASKAMYASPAIQTSQRVERCNVNLPTAMRAPVEGPGTWALGSAMDELAHALGMDPLDLRLLNYAEVDPAHGRPWSSKKLREAYEEGASLFGWRGRQTRREGAWIVAQGMADCTMGTFRFPSAARLTLRADGSALIESGFHDIGSGTLTIFPQVAADVLGLDPADIEVRHGDTTLPQAGPTYGSSSTIGVGGAVWDAACKVRDQLARLSNLPPDTPVRDAMRRASVPEIVAEGCFALPGGKPFEADGSLTPYAMRTFGAVFVEVAVDPELGLLRLRRAVGSYSAGRIINVRTARAQMTGGIIWGWGMAAMEASTHEAMLGRWLSKNLSGVAIPISADIPGDAIQVHFVDEVDEHAGPLGGKGIGELGATGVAAAVANAVFAATGRRVRNLPLTPEKLVGSSEG